MKKNKFFWLIAIFAIIFMGFTACGNGDDNGYPPDQPPINGGGPDNGGGPPDTGTPTPDPQINFTIRQSGGIPLSNTTEGIYFDFVDSRPTGVGLSPNQIILSGAAAMGEGAQLIHHVTAGNVHTYRLSPIVVSAAGPVSVNINHPRFSEIPERQAVVLMGTMPAPDYFVVNWNLAGGSWAAGTTPPVSGGWRNEIIPPFPNPTRPGFMFAGWFIDDGTGVINVANTEDIPILLTSNHNLIAGWMGFRLTQPVPVSGVFPAQGPIEFSPSPAGAAALPAASAAPVTVRVINTGNMATGPISVIRTGANPLAFNYVPGASFAGGLGVNVDDTFVIQVMAPPNPVLGTPGLRTATINVVCDDTNVTASVNVSFNVSPSIIDITTGTAASIIGLINNAFNNLGYEVVTVIGSRTTGAFVFNPNIPANKRLIFDATLTPSGAAITHAGDGILEIAENAVITTIGANVAINSTGSGPVIISGGTITSSTVLSTTGTVVVAGTGAGERLIITGGTINNTTVNANSVTINNLSPGEVVIEGGQVNANIGTAIRSSNGGLISISQENALVPTLITSANVTPAAGTIVIPDAGAGDRLVMTGGTVINTAANADARAINNHSAGDVRIAGGIVEANAGQAIRNAHTGNVYVTAGTVAANTGIAIYNADEGVIQISQPNNNSPALITSSNTNLNEGTIVLANVGAGGQRLNMTGGRVENMVPNFNALAINNRSSGVINISGGWVVANWGNAIRNNYTGSINVSQTQPILAPTFIRSSTHGTASGTIFIAQAGTAPEVRLTVTGGIVDNIAPTGPRWAIFNNCTHAETNLTGGNVGNVHP